MRNPRWLLDTAAGLPEVGSVLRDAGFVVTTPPELTAAHTALTSPVAGPGWFTVGDAAMGFDPISSQGLFNALYTGLAAAEASHRTLDGAGTAYQGYCADLAQIASAYQAHLTRWYGEERRWPGSTFWLRRHALTTRLPQAA